MLETDATHYRCAWIEDSITVHSDGNVSCGLDDPHGQRSFGNIHSQSIDDIFKNREYYNLQRKLWDGHRCRDCGHFRPAQNTDFPTINSRPLLPSRLVIEATVRCNIRCPNPPCLANNDPLETTRNADSLSLDAFKSVIDQLEATLKTVHFYNYGEPFLHRQAEDMLLYLRQKCSNALVVTSTNGIPLSKAGRAEKLVLAAPDRVTFTISGVTQETYSRYHITGQMSQALQGLKNVCEAKRLSGQSLPQVIWRYLVFHWNDSDEEIDAALAIARQFGVDKFSLYLTNTPPGCRSIRFSPGSPSFLKYRQYIHFDDEGRLDHEYNCEIPDENGLYHFERSKLPGCVVRWSSSEARLRLKPTRGRLQLQVSTSRKLSRSQNHTCVLHAPWGEYKIPLIYKRWRYVSIPIPRNFSASEEIEIKLIAANCWYPATEGSSGDLRCLGVLIRQEDTADDSGFLGHLLRTIYMKAAASSFLSRAAHVC